MSKEELGRNIHQAVATRVTSTQIREDNNQGRKQNDWN